MEALQFFSCSDAYAPLHRSMMLRGCLGGKIAIGADQPNAPADRLRSSPI
jgi:hypothetical protein